MKIIIYPLLVVLGLHYATAAPKYKYTYGIGGSAGFDYHGDREVGFHLANGTYSAFTKGSFAPGVYGDAGVLIGSDTDTAVPNETQKQPSSQQSTGVAPFNYYQTPVMPQYAPQYPNQQYNPYLPQQNYIYGQSPYSPFQPPTGQFGPNAMPAFNQFQPFPGASNSPYQTQGAAQNALPTPQNGLSIPAPQPGQDNTVTNNVPEKV